MFQRVYEYYVQQRNAQKRDPEIDDAKIWDGLSSIVNKREGCFEVDQLVFLDMNSMT